MKNELKVDVTVEVVYYEVYAKTKTLVNGKQSGELDSKWLFNLSKEQFENLNETT